MSVIGQERTVTGNPSHVHLSFDKSPHNRAASLLVGAMNRLTGPLLFLCCALSMPLALAQDSGPADSIREARLEDYIREYPPSPLCEQQELTLWSCSVGNREYALCSSRVVSRTEGYFQYRASKAGKTVFVYPAAKQSPAGSFTYKAYLNGNASLEFVNDGYHYSLVDPLRDNSSILVASPKGNTSAIECGGNQTLQLNYTMRLMYEAGVWDR
jgi:hypothetical protein